MVSAHAWPPAPDERFSPAGVRRAALASRLDGLRFGAPLRPDTAGFPPDQRLHTPAEFGRVFAEPARSSDRLFTVLARPSGRSTARLGLTVARRVAKRAVDRNKIKRLARESFRQLRALPPWDFVVLARAGADRAERRVLRASLDQHFEQLTKAAAAAKQHG
jgi:ribonuclease P protein component